MNFSSILTGVLVARFIHFILYTVFSIVIAVVAVKELEAIDRNGDRQQTDRAIAQQLVEKYLGTLVVATFGIHFVSGFFAGGATASMAKGAEKKNGLILSLALLVVPSLLTLAGYNLSSDPYQRASWWSVLAEGAGTMLGPYAGACLIAMARKEEEAAKDSGVGLK